MSMLWSIARSPVRMSSFSTDPLERQTLQGRAGELPLREEVRDMAVYTIIRVYEVPADTQQQATDRMMEALALHVERDFHKKGTHLRRDTVILQWFQASKAAAASDGHAVHC